MNPKEFDRLFDEAFEEAAKQLNTTPDSSSSWERVRAAVQRQERNRRTRKRLQLVGVIAGSVLLGSFLFGQPVVTRAFPPIAMHLQSVGDQIVGLFFGTEQRDRTAKTEPPPNGTQGLSVTGTNTEERQEKVTREEAAAKTAFPFPDLPTVDGFRINEIVLYYEGAGSQARQAKIVYVSDDERSINVYLSKLTTETIASSAAGNPDSKIEQITVQGNQTGILVPLGRGRYSLEFLMPAFHVLILGNVSQAEIVQAANGIKPR